VFDFNVSIWLHSEFTSFEYHNRIWKPVLARGIIVVRG
jgi:hypothetical protein